MSDYPVLSEEQLKACTSETAKYRSETGKYCIGCGVDIASQGNPVVIHAIQFDLPEAEFLKYSSGRPPASPIPLRGHADKLPFTDSSLDFVYSSHLLEDYFDWNPVLNEWIRCLKPGGNLIILVPDQRLWGEAIRNGQAPNCEHRHESRVGELSEYCVPKGITVIEDRLTLLYPGDYTILFVGKKV